MMHILLLETIAPGADQILRAGATVHLSDSPTSGPSIAKQFDVSAIVTRGKGDVSAELIDLCPNLRVIARCGVGLDNVDVAYATVKGIKVVNAPGANADTVAEHTLALMLSLQRQIFASVTAVKAGNWAFRNSFGGDEIRGKTLAILGYGNIGKRVEQLALAFGMKVIHGARAAGSVEPRTQVQGEGGNSDAASSGLPLKLLLAQADILSLHLPLTEATRGLLTADLLDLLPPEALIINTARGEVVDEAALTQRLQHGRLGGYAADVLSVEPPAPSSPLLALPNVLITPHAASLTARTYEHICTLTVENTLSLLNSNQIDSRFIANGPTN
jgi:phosphoglycerate dehydrogenase-like enzyme